MPDPPGGVDPSDDDDDEQIAPVWIPTTDDIVDAVFPGENGEVVLPHFMELVEEMADEVVA